ncbi:MAG TPA: SelT/SelW/SelH family protein [Candidatus Polarisedimenticolia bacterium]|jgi:selenoprotein W-related protein|nr:SelT/SelW/SelH family protein [Candidatus Polarisedimenticolia bacterium]
MPKPRLEIAYCTQCRWLLRAAWMAQELLTTFEAELGEVALRPATGGVFDVILDGETLWSRSKRRRFPDIKELKQLVRDRVAPGRNLGHSDRKPVRRHASGPAPGGRRRRTVRSGRQTVAG